jgi:hypothetical protein
MGPLGTRIVNTDQCEASHCVMTGSQIAKYTENHSSNVNEIRNA